MLAERFAVDMDAAFEPLRRYARDHNLELTEPAYAVTRGGIALEPSPCRLPPPRGDRP